MRVRGWEPDDKEYRRQSSPTRLSHGPSCSPQGRGLGFIGSRSTNLIQPKDCNLLSAINGACACRFHSEELVLGTDPTTARTLSPGNHEKMFASSSISVILASQRAVFGSLKSGSRFLGFTMILAVVPERQVSWAWDCLSAAYIRRTGNHLQWKPTTRLGGEHIQVWTVGNVLTAVTVQVYSVTSPLTTLPPPK